MFVRTVKIRSSNGTVHEYVRIVSSVRDNGRVKQKVVANLGRRDTLEAVLPMLNRFLHGEDDQQLAQQLAEQGSIEVLDSSTWGPTLVARHLFEQLGLWQLLDAGRRWSQLLPDEDPNDDWPSRVLALLPTAWCVRAVSMRWPNGWRPISYVIDKVAATCRVGISKDACKWT